MDEWGRTIKQGNQHYEYDSQNRLVKITSTDETGNLIPVASYRYNTFNQRIAKTTYSNQGSTTKTTYYFYDGNQLIAETIDAATQTAKNLKQYIWLNDTPIAILEKGDLYYIHTDHRNAPIAVTDSISKLVWQADNEDFGYASIHAKSSFELNLRLSNQYYDKESGLHYNTNRYYDAVNLRYLTPDPLGLAAGPDLFAFALNQPHSISDPDGLAPSWNELPTNAEVSKWSSERKIQWVFNYTAGFFKDDVQTALRELASPAVIATTAAVFGIWAVAQFTPYGWAADVALAGIGAFFIGKAIGDVIVGLYNASKILKPTCTASDLLQAGDSLRRAIQAATQSLATSAGALAGAKMAGFLRTIFKDKSKSFTQAKRAEGDQKRYGAFKVGRTRSGNTANSEAQRRSEAAGYGDGFRPPWSKWKTVTDTWLNPGDKVYMLVNKGATNEQPGLGGWVSPDKFSSLKDARQKLALLPEFKTNSQCCDLVELSVRTPTPVRSGEVGSLISRETGALYRGGARQSELLISMKGNDWEKYFRVTNIKKGADLK